MKELQIVIGALLGYGTGVGIWWLVRHFVVHYQARPVPVEVHPVVRLWREPRGATSPVAAITQAGMALFGAYVWWQATDLSQVIGALVVTGLLVSISLVDLAVHRIPNALVLGLVVWAAVQILWLGRPAPLAAALGMLLGGGLFLLIAVVGRGTMGMGDVKLVAALGAVLGYPLIVPALFAGILAGGVAALALLATRRIGRKDYMAYGPYLALGAWVMLMHTQGLWP